MENQGNWQYAKREDFCDCDQRCQKCGKVKKQPERIDWAPQAPLLPQPQLQGYWCSRCYRYHGAFEVCPRPWITWSTTNTSALMSQAQEV